MGEVNVPRDEREAVKAVDMQVLSDVVDQCLRDERPFALRGLRLENCGPYIYTKLRAYEQALRDHAAAKAATKREMTDYSARRAGSDLVAAVEAMKHRVKTEEQEDQLFHVDDLVSPPVLLNEHLSVRVNYHWRRAIGDEWVFGSITFLHDVDMQSDYSRPPPARKPSAAKQAEVRREKFHGEWEHLMRQALYSVKEFFRKGGVGSSIPTTYHAKVDAHTRGLNNFSCRFWQESPPV
jgi:hypothetical protein